MWDILKSEISYHRFLLLVLMGLVPITIFLETAIEDMNNMLLLAILFIMVHKLGHNSYQRTARVKVFLITSFANKNQQRQVNNYSGLLYFHFS